VRDDGYPPPNGIGMKMIARKHSASQLIFYDCMYFFTMAATLVIPSDKIWCGDISIRYNSMNFIAILTHRGDRERVFFGRRSPGCRGKKAWLRRAWSQTR
jgi:hypothetical protein